MKVLQKKRVAVPLDLFDVLYITGLLLIIVECIMCDAVFRMALPVGVRFLIPFASFGCFTLCNIKNGIRIHFHTTDLLLLLMLIFIFCNNYYTGGMFFYKFLRYASVFMAIFYLQKKDGWISLMIRVFFCVYVVYAVLTIWFYFDGNFYLNRVVPLFQDKAYLLIKWYNSGCMAGFTEHYSYNGIFLAFGILIYAANLVNPDANKLIAGIALFLCSIAMLMTGKRGPLLFSAAALLVMYFAYHSNERDIQKKIVKIIAIAAITGAVLFVLYNFVPQLATFISRFQDAADEGDVTMGRTFYWEIAMDRFWKHPIMGIGWFQIVGEINAELGLDNIMVHNIYLQLLCETGVIGFCIFITWFTALFYMTLQLIIKCRRGYIKCNDRVVFHLLLSCGIQVFFLSYGMTGNPLYDIVVFVPYFLFCGVTLYYKNTLRKNNRIYWQRKLNCHDSNSPDSP